jgi:cobalt-zinc-cadmium efflux system outer membrane protein
MRTFVLAASLGWALLGCVSVSEDAGFSEVQALSEERAGAKLTWIRGIEEDREVVRKVRDILSQPLSVDAAVQIALLNNRSLQATYEDLGLSQAELVQAGLLLNPVFSGAFRYPTEAPRSLNLEFDLVGSFLELLFLPARKQAASLEFEERKLTVSHAVLELATETRNAYFSAISARQVADLRKLIAEAAEASAEFAKRLHDAGNLPELAATLERASYEQARIDWSRAETAVVEARERLTRMMGLWGSDVHWKAPDKLPDVPLGEPPLDRAESLAISRRLDFQAAIREVQVASAALGVTRRSRWLGDDLELGASAEREPGGDWLVGPALAIRIPAFDQGQARVAIGESLLRQREHRLTALAVGIRSEVRRLRDRLVRDRQRLEHYLKVVIPLRERAVELTQERYNFMLVGTHELLEAKRHEFNAYQEYIEAVRDYWMTRSEFLRAIGGAVPETK